MFRDVRYALRILRQNPGFTAVAVLSLALGIGVNSAVFSFADALLMRPLPVLRPHEVVTLSGTAPDIPFGTFGRASYPDYVDFRDHSKSFDGLVAFAFAAVGVTEEPEALPQLRLALAVSGNFLRVMGVEPALGRAFAPEEDRVPGRDAVLVLGHDAWQRLGGDPKIVGRTLRLNDVAFTVVGVAPQEFPGTDPFVRPDLFFPVMMLPRVAASTGVLGQRDDRRFTVKGRLRPGVGLEQAEAELAGIARSLEQAYPGTNRDRSVRVRTELQARADQSPLNAALAAVLLGLAGLVLITACANVANLLLSRARSRSREMALRLAVGAGRGRLLRQLLTESLIVALAGGALGLLLADSAVSYFSTLQFASDLPVAFSARLDQRVLIFSLIAAAVSALLCGLAPAICSARTDLVSALKTGETNGLRRRTLGKNALVAGQVALSLMLLMAATVFLHTFRAVLFGNPGFRTDHLLFMAFDPTLVRYSPEKTQEFYRTLRRGSDKAGGRVRADSVLDEHGDERRDAMAEKRPITVWYDREGDFLEVLFERKPGYFRQTSSDQVMEKVDEEGHVIGFHILRASRVTQPLELELAG